MAARRSGLTLGQWLNRAIRGAAAEELGTARNSSEAALPALPNDHLLDAIQERLDRQRSAIEEIFLSGLEEQANQVRDTPRPEPTVLKEVRQGPVGLSEELQAELDEIKLLIHDYMALLLPAAEPIENLSRQLQDISNLAAEMRKSANAAEQVVAAVAPLERAILRISGGNSAPPQAPDPSVDRRGNGLGKLFRN